MTTVKEFKDKENKNPIKCSDLVGIIFYNFGVMSTIEKTTYGYRKFYCREDGSEVLGAGVNGDGVFYFKNENVNRWGRAITFFKP